MDWKRYLLQRETDEKRRKRERANAERKAETLMAQADKMRAKATKAVAAQNMAKRAEKLLAGLEETRAADRVARIRLPKPAPSGKTPLTAKELSKSYGSLEVFTDVDLAIDRGSKVVVLGLNGAGKTTLLRILAGIESSDTGKVLPGHGLRLGYYAQEHETLDVSRSVLENMVTASPELNETEVRKILGSFLFTGDDVEKPARVLSGGEKTRLALAMLVVSAANVLLLDEPTNNLDPASRGEVLNALRDYAGRGRPRHPRRGRRACARTRPGAPAARRRRGSLEPRLRRPDQPRLIGRALPPFPTRPGQNASTVEEGPGSETSSPVLILDTARGSSRTIAEHGTSRRYGARFRPAAPS